MDDDGGYDDAEDVEPEFSTRRIRFVNVPVPRGTASGLLPPSTGERDRGGVGRDENDGAIAVTVPWPALLIRDVAEFSAMLGPRLRRTALCGVATTTSTTAQGAGGDGRGTATTSGACDRDRQLAVPDATAAVAASTVKGAAAYLFGEPPSLSRAGGAAQKIVAYDATTASHGVSDLAMYASVVPGYQQAMIECMTLTASSLRVTTEDEAASVAVLTATAAAPSLTEAEDQTTSPSHPPPRPPHDATIVGSKRKTTAAARKDCAAVTASNIIARDKKRRTSPSSPPGAIRWSTRVVLNSHVRNTRGSSKDSPQTGLTREARSSSASPNRIGARGGTKNRTGGGSKKSGKSSHPAAAKTGAAALTPKKAPKATAAARTGTARRNAQNGSSSLDNNNLTEEDRRRHYHPVGTILAVRHYDGRFYEAEVTGHPYRFWEESSCPAGYNPRGPTKAARRGRPVRTIPFTDLRYFKIAGKNKKECVDLSQPQYFVVNDETTVVEPVPGDDDYDDDDDQRRSRRSSWGVGDRRPHPTHELLGTQLAVTWDNDGRVYEGRVTTARRDDPNLVRVAFPVETWIENVWIDLARERDVKEILEEDDEDEAGGDDHENDVDAGDEDDGAEEDEDEEDENYDDDDDAGDEDEDDENDDAASSAGTAEMSATTTTTGRRVGGGQQRSASVVERGWIPRRPPPPKVLASSSSTSSSDNDGGGFGGRAAPPPGGGGVDGGGRAAPSPPAAAAAAPPAAAAATASFGSGIDVDIMSEFGY